MRFAVTFVALLLALSVASQALAKDGVVARLDNPAALRARAGATIHVTWTLRTGTQAFGASFVYVRLHGRAGKTTSAYAVESAPGKYRARLRVPAGGALSVVIGLRGWSSGPSGTTRADELFPITNDPL